MKRLIELKRGEMLCLQNRKVMTTLPFWNDGYVLYGLTTFMKDPYDEGIWADANEAVNCALYSFKGNCIIVKAYDTYRVSAYQHFDSAKEAFEYAMERYDTERTLSEHFIIKKYGTKEIIYQQ